MRRSQMRIEKRKKTVKRTILACVPVVLCLTVVSGYLTLGGFGRATEAAPGAGQMPHADFADKIVMESAMEPAEAAPMDPAEPEAAATSACLELMRQGVWYYYTDPEQVDTFAQILNEPKTGTVEGDAAAEENGSTAEVCTVIFTHPDGVQEQFTLTGDRMEDSNGTIYLLTEEQSQWLYNLMQ